MSRMAFMMIGVAVLTLAGILGGCGPTPNVIDPYIQGPKAAQGKVPRPVDLLLPQKIRIHPFTALRTLEDRNVMGIEARIEALDAFGDPTKAFGDVRFELYAYRANSLESKGDLLNVWSVSIADANNNLLHWDRVTRAYLFKLELTQQAEPADRYVLVAIFDSPYTQRLFAEHVMMR
ncbi:MAG: hypothetical protein FWE88_01655 [Phycisphaerae bacterium]|nr:hypothetical protein [Phycisphaerae bacterium]